MPKTFFFAFDHKLLNIICNFRNFDKTSRVNLKINFVQP